MPEPDRGRPRALDFADVAELIGQSDFEARSGRLIDAIVDGIASVLPEMQEDAGLRALVRSSVDQQLDAVVAAIAGGTDPVVLEPLASGVEVARQFARKGVPVASLMRSFQAGQTRGWRAFVAELRDFTQDPAVIAQVLEETSLMQNALLEQLSQSFTEAYVVERERWVRSALAVRVEVVSAILDTGPIDVQEAGARLGYDLGLTHVGFVVWARDGADHDRVLPDLERTAAEVGRALGAGDPLLLPAGPLAVHGWATGPSDSAAGLPELEPSTTVALGTPAAGLDGFRRTHREALHARRVAELTGAGTVVRFADVALTALASADPRLAREFVERELGELADPGVTTRALALTLRVFLEEHASPRRAAHRLGLHENTVAKRAREAEDLLGRPLDARPAETLVALTLLDALVP